jgi:hypothetical protein
VRIEKTEEEVASRQTAIGLVVLACAVAIVILAFFLASATVVLGGIVIAGSLVCLGSFVFLHFLPTGYDPIRNAVSDYGVGRHRIWHRVAVVSLAAAGFATAIASLGTMKPEPASVVAFLCVFATARVFIPLFPTDIEGQPRTRAGRVHWVLAITAFVSLAVAAGFFKGTGLDDIVGWFVVITAILMILVLCVPRLRRRIFGLVERLFYFSMISWFLIVGVELLLLVSGGCRVARTQPTKWKILFFVGSLLRSPFFRPSLEVLQPCIQRVFKKLVVEEFH